MVRRKIKLPNQEKQLNKDYQHQQKLNLSQFNLEELLEPLAKASAGKWFLFDAHNDVI